MGLAVMNLQQPGRIIPLVVDAKHQHFLNFAGALAYDPINDGMWLGTNDGLFFYDMKRRQFIEPFRGCQNVRGCIGYSDYTKGQTPDGVCAGNGRGRPQVRVLMARAISL